MHGKIMDGRALVVRLRSEGPRPGGGGGGERPRGFAPGENDESKVLVKACIFLGSACVNLQHLRTSADTWARH